MQNSFHNNYNSKSSEEKSNENNKSNEKKIEDKIITYRKEDSKDKLMNREQKRETQEYYEFTF